MIDEDIMIANLKAMQAKADHLGVVLQPHTKTHKMPYIAKLQLQFSAQGITVAKTGEAKVMADAGIYDILITNEIVGEVGKGYIKNSDGIYVDNVFDEHTIINSAKLHDMVNIGDKIEIIPNHICPCVNLYDQAYMVKAGKIVDILPVSGRGKIC